VRKKEDPRLGGQSRPPCEHRSGTLRKAASRLPHLVDGVDAVNAPSGEDELLAGDRVGGRSTLPPPGSCCRLLVGGVVVAELRDSVAVLGVGGELADPGGHGWVNADRAARVRTSRG
jgi:hypothetical protein